MIYLDTTNACRTRTQTGIQRVVRGLARHLTELRPVLPLVWSPAWQNYCTLQAEQRENLHNPFRNRKFAAAQPAKSPNTKSAKFFRWLHQRFHQLPLARAMKPGDLLLVPEVFQDDRIDFFARLLPLPTGKAWAFFHDALAWSLPEYSPADPSARFPAYMAALARFDGVICISRESEAELQRFWREKGIAPAPTRVLHWPMPLTEARPPSQPEFAKRRALFVATLEPRKNHLRLLEACRRLWEKGIEFHLELIGRSLGEGPIERMIHDLQGRGFALTWLKHVDDTTLSEAYKNCSFTVYPSVREGFGLPILESLWHGRPCLCGGNGALGEVAEGGGCLLVDQLDPEALSLGLERLVTDETLYTRLYDETMRRAFRGWEAYVPELLTQIE